MNGHNTISLSTETHLLLNLFDVINVSTRYTVEDTGEFSAKALERAMDHWARGKTEYGCR